MDSEFRNLLSAVVQGKIQDPERVRQILHDALTAIEAKEEALASMRRLYFEARDAFIIGWQT